MYTKKLVSVSWIVSLSSEQIQNLQNFFLLDSMKYRLSKTDGVIKILWPPTTIKDIFQNLNDWDYYLELKKKRKIRSHNQNDFYWWPFLDCLLTEMWEINRDFMTEYEIETAKEIVHEFLKWKFIDWKDKTITFKNPKDKRKRFSVEVKSQKSTTELDTKEFEQYLERIRNHFARWGWKLPYPEDEQEYNYLNNL